MYGLGGGGRNMLMVTLDRHSQLGVDPGGTLVGLQPPLQNQLTLACCVLLTTEVCEMHSDAETNAGKNG